MLQSIRWSFSLIIIALAFMACVKPAPPPLKPPRFDQERAFHRLRDLCAFGPRNHGSEGKTKAEAWIQKNLRDAGAEV